MIEVERSKDRWGIEVLTLYKGYRGADFQRIGMTVLVKTVSSPYSMTDARSHDLERQTQPLITQDLFTDAQALNKNHQVLLVGLILDISITEFDLQTTNHLSINTRSPFF